MASTMCFSMVTLRLRNCSLSGINVTKAARSTVLLPDPLPPSKMVTLSSRSIWAYGRSSQLTRIIRRNLPGLLVFMIGFSFNRHSDGIDLGDELIEPVDRAFASEPSAGRVEQVEEV